MGDDEDNQEGIGFSGISSLLLDDPPDAAAQQPAQAAHLDGSQSAAELPARGTTGSAPSKPPAPASQPTQPRHGGGAVWAWIGGVAVVVFLIWAANQSGTQPSGQSAYQPAVTQPDTTQSSTQGNSDQGSSPSATAAQSGVPDLQTPPISSGNVYSVAEIRYCLALKQQVEGAKPVVDTYNQGQVERFNAMVDDYNGRCHNFLYHTGDLEQAQRDMTPFSDQLQAQGRQVVQGGTTSRTSDIQTNADNASRQTVLYVQRTLNALGFDAGTPDGAMGSRTRTAIERFQRENYLPANGRISASLIDHLHAAEILLGYPPRNLPISTRKPSAFPVKRTAASSPQAASGTDLVHAQMIGSCNPAYPVDAARSAQTGTTILAVRVGSDGGVTTVDIVSSAGSTSLDRAAVSALEQCRFIPASRDGQPVMDELRIPVSFNFERRPVRSRTW